MSPFLLGRARSAWRPNPVFPNPVFFSESRFFRAGPGRPSVTDPSSVTDARTTWIYIQDRQPAKPLWVKYIFVKGSIGSQSFNPKPFRYTLQFFTPCKALCTWIFPLYFQLRYLPEESCFQQAGSSLKVPAGCSRIFWPAEGTSQPVTISKKWKNPTSTLTRKRTWVQALQWFLTCYLGLLASGTDLKSRKVLRPFSYILHSSIWDSLEVGPHNYTWSGNHCWVNIPPSIPIIPTFENHRTLWFVF
jgi:hypothetical protein